MDFAWDWHILGFHRREKNSSWILHHTLAHLHILFLLERMAACLHGCTGSHHLPSWPRGLRNDRFVVRMVSDEDEICAIQRLVVLIATLKIRNFCLYFDEKCR